MGDDEEDQPYVTWQPRKWPPKKHDHVGSMVFVDDEAACKDCGQMWTLQPPDEHYNKWRYQKQAVKSRIRSKTQKRRR